MIIGYIHIWQKSGWEQIFDLILKSLKESRLYDQTLEIRIGIVSDNAIFHRNNCLDDRKFKIIYNGHSEECERPTLLHMRSSSELDPPSTLYWYLHTKGISHLGTDIESNVIDWVKMMLYWNVERYQNAVEALLTYDTYGCNYNFKHYSGNFWWATRNHIKRLPDFIDSYYTAPEDWVCTFSKRIFCAFKSGYKAYHYKYRFPRSHYIGFGLYYHKFIGYYIIRCKIKMLRSLGLHQ